MGKRADLKSVMLEHLVVRCVSNAAAIVTQLECSAINSLTDKALKNHIKKIDHKRRF